MSQIADILAITGVCPILVRAIPEYAVKAAKALARGGDPVLEILLRDEDSYINIANVAKDVPETIVGAGTVLNLEQAKRVADLGAKFMVLPGFHSKVVEFCLDNNIDVLPGCVTPSEIIMALDYGINIVKFFPVYQMGGVETLRQYTFGPFPTVKYVVTGGLGKDNYLPLLRHKNTLAAGGDWMFTEDDALERGDFTSIEDNVRRSIYQVLDQRESMK